MPLSAADAVLFTTAIDAMCRDAGAILMSHFRKLAEYQKKGDIDLVTVADKESEAAILGAIRLQFPNHAVLAEESGAGGGANSEYLWVIDPLDGTTNFAHGMANFAISIGLQHNGTTIAAGICAPALGETFLAARGHGATRNSAPIRVSSVEQLANALVVTGFPYNRGEILDWLLPTLGDFLRQSQGVLRLGAAALDLAYVAAGYIDAFYEANLHPWDMAAGALLVEEAGGRMSTFDGSPFDITTKRMLATNTHLHEQAMAVLKNHPFRKQWERAG